LILDRVAHLTAVEAPRSQSLGNLCAVMCTRRITCVDALAKLVSDG